MEEGKGIQPKLCTGYDCRAVLAKQKSGRGEIYESLLNLGGDGVMGYLEIPKIKLKLPVMHGVDDDVLARAVGHLPQTSPPVGGKSSHGHYPRTGTPQRESFLPI